MHLLILCSNSCIIHLCYMLFAIPFWFSTLLGLYSFTSFRSVGTATAAFAMAILEGSIQPGVWFPEEVKNGALSFHFSYFLYLKEKEKKVRKRVEQLLGNCREKFCHIRVRQAVMASMVWLVFVHIAWRNHNWGKGSSSQPRCRRNTQFCNEQVRELQSRALIFLFRKILSYKIC